MQVEAFFIGDQPVHDKVDAVFGMMRRLRTVRRRNGRVEGFELKIISLNAKGMRRFER